ncbi:cytochrome c oxidase subunit II [Pseudochelatococcus sp. B33]
MASDNLLTRIPVSLRLLPCVLTLAACEGRQSALHPAGQDASQIHVLFIVMLAGAVVLWAALNGLFFYVTRIHRGSLPVRRANLLIVAGGVLLPTVMLGALLGWALSMMPAQRAPGAGLVIRITAEEWWWRVEYWPRGATEPVVTANEIRLPAGERSELRLTAGRYIHSFWIPALGGKMDAIPGRETVLTLHPEREGRYRGQCAEFCGASHAFMAFEAVVLSPDRFEEWLAREAAPARPPAGPEAQRGAALFRDEGCGACHTIRGTDFAGPIGPDLTHLGSRASLAAGTLKVERADLARWIARSRDIKPGVAMPAYDWLEPEALQALAAYLEGLE